MLVHNVTQYMGQIRKQYIDVHDVNELNAPGAIPVMPGLFEMRLGVGVN